MNLDDISDKNAWATVLDNNDICPKELMTNLIALNCEFLWHPLGFAMCRVAKWGRVSMRVHLWPNHSNFRQNPSWLIHDHVFNLKSWVISGEIENQEYSVEYGERGHAIYEVKYDSSKSILKKTNLCCSRKLSKVSVYSRGECYEVNSGVFHESRSLSDRTVLTVCKTLDEATRAPRVLGDMSGLESYTFLRRRVDEDEIIALAKAI